jgi:hypothetical protein
VDDTNQKLDGRSSEVRKLRKRREAFLEALYWAQDDRVGEYRRAAHRERADACLLGLGGLGSSW